MVKILTISIFILFISTGCSPKNSQLSPIEEASAPVPKVDLSNKSQDFRDGYSDGCQSAKGNYTKDSSKFKSNAEYNEGWFAGRSSCQDMS